MPLTFEEILQEAQGLVADFNPPFGNFTRRFNIVQATQALFAYVRMYQRQSFEVLLMAPNGHDSAGLHRAKYQALYDEASGLVRTELDGLAITTVRQNPRGKRFFAAILVKAYDAQNTLNDEQVDRNRRLRFLGSDMVTLYREWKHSSTFNHWGMRLTVNTEEDVLTFYGAHDILEPEEVLNQPEETDDEQENGVQVRQVPAVQQQNDNNN